MSHHRGSRCRTGGSQRAPNPPNCSRTGLAGPWAHRDLPNPCSGKASADGGLGKHQELRPRKLGFILVPAPKGRCGGVASIPQQPFPSGVCGAAAGALSQIHFPLGTSGFSRCRSQSYFFPSLPSGMVLAEGRGGAGLESPICHIPLSIPNFSRFKVSTVLPVFRIHTVSWDCVSWTRYGLGRNPRNPDPPPGSTYVDQQESH